MNETKLSPAIELASRMNENTHSITRVDAVAAGKMLRRQHEAIKQLRGALKNYVESDETAREYGVGVGGDAMDIAEQALKDTEGLCKD